MAIVKFYPKGGIRPLFALKLAETFNKIIKEFGIEKAEEIIKVALNIDKNRVVDIREVEDGNGDIGFIIILYDFISKYKRPKTSIPQTEEGFFDFNIYQLDFNINIDVEKIIKDQRKYLVK
ncbi:MAG: hypothetical protein PWP46_1260 [Fusobacteriaceae bacterium]|jgi:hypothetical protein|nr:hypothetical protein [Fusobacteriaceae bacterium]